MSLYINSINEDEILTSYNFARKSGIVFSEVVTKDQYKVLQRNTTEVIEETENSVFYFDKKIKVNENDIIFTNSYLVEALFDKLKDLSFYNLKVISSQTDHFINKKMFNKKPKSVSYWYSTNVNYRNHRLKPIPLGLANYYSPKNLFKKDFQNLELEERNNSKIYVNFETNTNYFHRNRLKKSISKSQDAFIENETLTLTDYLIKLNNYKFVLCPWGNGLDTHRIWETLYAGSYPIIPYHFSFEKIFKDDNLLFNQINSLDIKKLNRDFDNQIKSKTEILNINYWIEKIRNSNDKLNNDDVKEINFSYNNIIKFYNKKKKTEFQLKKIYTFSRKIHNKLFNK